MSLDDDKLRGCNPVLLVAHLAPGGCEKQGYLLARALKERSMRPGVIVWTLTPEDFYRSHLEKIDIPLVTAPQNQGRWAKLRRLRSLVRTVRPPVLHSMAFFLNSAAAWAAQMSSTIAVGAIRSDYEFEADQGYIHYAVNRRWPKTIIANSERAWQAALADRSVFRPRKPLIVFNGIDLSLYMSRSPGTPAVPQILGVGNLYPGKRWDRLLQSMAGLIASRPELPFTVKIAGEGSERCNLQRLIQQLDLEQSVTLLGRRLDIPDLLSESDIFVMASDSEGTPNAVMEAMAAGLPVVATDVGDVSRLVADGINGFVVPCHEQGHDPMASALAKLLTDPGLRARMGAAGRARAESEFGLDRLAERVLRAYRQAGWGQS